MNLTAYDGRGCKACEDGELCCKHCPEIARLTRERDAFADDCRSRDDRIARLVDSAKTHRLDIEGLSAALAKAEGERDDYQRQCDSLRRQDTGTIDALRAQLASFCRELEDRRERYKAVCKHSDEAYAARDAVMRQLAEAREECRMLRDVATECAPGEVFARELTRLRAVEARLIEQRRAVATDEDTDWTNCPDVNCAVCRVAKANLLSLLDAIIGAGPGKVG